MRHADYKRPIAVITGATSGIGAEFARRLASQGYDLVVTGRRKEKISALVKEIEDQYGTQVETILCELSNSAHVDRLVKRILDKDEVAILVNNAGFGFTEPFADSDLEIFLAMLRVHIDTTLRLVHAVLPGMRKRQKGTIINVSSMLGIVPAPLSSVYAGTKAFLNLFTESLHMELRRDNIRVQTLMPGFTKTDFHDQMRLRKQSESSEPGTDTQPPSRGPLRFMSPEKVVSASLAALKRGKVICIPGLRNRFLAALSKFIPRRMLYSIVGRWRKQ